ncbi:MAG: uracil phosphoribosyltransferase [Verrucomicrobiae bacterium]
MKNVTVINHPLVQHNLTRLRDARTQPQEFRRLLNEIAALMTYEATRSFAVKKISVRTPLEKTTGGQLQNEIVLVPVLRAGLGMLDGILEMIPHARVGFLGLKRDETTLAAHFYSKSLPKNLRDVEIILIDPMLATGGSAVAALDYLREQGAKNLRLVSLVAAPEGIARVQKSYPKLPIFTAAIDRQLNKIGYILPGLGDAGDRLFGT